MRKSGRKGVRHTKSFHFVCAWCGDDKAATRPDAVCCSGLCRQRLFRLIRMTGFAPDQPPGRRSVMEVYQELVTILLERERRRREVADRERLQYLAIKAVR